MVEAVEDPRLPARRGAVLAASSAGAACGGGVFGRLAARRSDASGVMIENGNPSLLCALAPHTGSAARSAAKTTTLNRFRISLIQFMRQIMRGYSDGD